MSKPKDGEIEVTLKGTFASELGISRMNWFAKEGSRVSHVFATQNAIIYIVQAFLEAERRKFRSTKEAQTKVK